MKNLKWWMRGGLLFAGAPAISGCYSTCPEPRPTIWSGTLADGGPYTGAELSREDCALACANTTVIGGPPYVCEPVDSKVVRCGVFCGGGRAPAGAVQFSAVNGTAGSWIARMAELEAAAVPAFAQLADELDTHRLEGCAHHARQAALEEIRHAQVVTRLALELGHCPAPLRVGPAHEVRSLEEIAIDNAREGCGRELFGAVLNQWQAAHATDERVRAVMGSIAADEHSHAKYAFELADTLAGRLTIPQRRRAKEAQEQMLAQLPQAEASSHARQLLGLMDVEQVAATARALLETRRI